MDHLPLRRSHAEVERPRHRPKRNGKPIPAVDGDDSDRQIDQLLLAERVPCKIVHVVGDLIDVDERDRFRPSKRGALSFRVERRFTPDTYGVEALLGFAE
jgi:hypothetical protein